MKIAKVRFDDPEELTDPSHIFITVVGQLELLDYSRRYFERIGDTSSIRRSQEIRKFYKQMILDYVYIVRSIIPDQVKADYIKLYCEKINKLKDE